jgi:phytoene dehydrogenase-like protein
VDATERIERQIERFAPGFRDIVLDRAVMAPADLQAWNPNLVGGDVNGGSLDLQQLIARPLLSVRPYRLPASTPSGSPLYVASASAPPGGGVHGMAGAHAARAVLKDHR